MELDKKILEKNKADIEAILKDAQEIAEKEYKSIIEEVENDYNKKYLSIKNDYQKQIATKERMLAFEKKQAELLAKQSVLTKIFNKVYEKLNQLEGKDLLKYVANKIKEVNYVGNEIMYVNKNEYNKYLKALSTKEKNQLVELDQLNAILNTQFQLSNEPIDIENGFLLEGKDFDLNFATNEIVKKLRDKHEREIAKELFK